nr:protein SENESCENCE-ASSOCIATED GENE 21, mitochondrial-like [Ipomoea batatas]GME10551.1 protein SENESCENCE-ASSOCIATED GENE 21, mitochondrial-like [Ipomoea batatas]
MAPMYILARDIHNRNTTAAMILRLDTKQKETDSIEPLDDDLDSDAIQVSNAKTSRSYTATATQGFVFGEVGRSNTMLKKGGDESGKSTTTSWIPDPVTGIY